MALITAARLQLFARGCDYMALAPKLEAARLEVAMTDVREVTHWLAQLYVESAGFTSMVENLNYSAVRLNQVWPHRFPTVEAAAPFAHSPQALANKVYGGRLELGNVNAGDGWKFIGRTPVMITGRDAYETAGAWTGLDLLTFPQQAESNVVGCRIAAHWWRENGLGAIAAADPGERAMASIAAEIQANELDDCRAERRRINGGDTGVDAAIAQLRRAGNIWRA